MTKDTPSLADEATIYERGQYWTRWNGGESAPTDWNGGRVLLAGGEIIHPYQEDVPFDWRHDVSETGCLEPGCIVGYVVNTRPTEARTGGDALLRDLRAWIKDEAQDKSWVAEDALIARIDEALSHPTPADDIGEGNLDCLAKRRPGEPMFIILGRDPDAEFITRLWGQRRHDAGDPEHAKQVFALADEMAAYEGKPESAPDASAYPPPADARIPDDVVEALGEVKTNIAWAEEHYSGPEFFDVAWPEIRKSLDALNTALTASGDARERTLLAVLRLPMPDFGPRGEPATEAAARIWKAARYDEARALLDTPPAGDGGGV